MAVISPAKEVCPFMHLWDKENELYKLLKFIKLEQDNYFWPKFPLQIPTPIFFWVELFDHKALKNTSPDINRDLTKEINGLPTGISKRFLEIDE
ncbi:MAG: hypothetical protein QMB20_04465 [Flavobacteriales bacterium]|jgi:hypothetical protein|tara:strand:- start:266 stop:547 length:282 start_codon:yes stop_codon:yes gene_type:complete